MVRPPKSLACRCGKQLRHMSRPSQKPAAQTCWLDPGVLVCLAACRAHADKGRAAQKALTGSCAASMPFSSPASRVESL